MKQLLSILPLLFLVSCGGQYDWIESEEIVGTGEVTAALFPYLERFESDLNTSIPSHLSIVIADTLNLKDDSGTDAVCFSSRETGIGQKVEIKRSTWKALSEKGREQLLYHELGHCVLNRGHRNDYEDGSTGQWCQSSIMNKFTFTELKIEECYKPDREDYLTELGA